MSGVCICLLQWTTEHLRVEPQAVPSSSRKGFALSDKHVKIIKVSLDEVGGLLPKIQRFCWRDYCWCHKLMCTYICMHRTHPKTFVVHKLFWWTETFSFNTLFSDVSKVRQVLIGQYNNQRTVQLFPGAFAPIGSPGLIFWNICFTTRHLAQTFQK